MVKAIGWVIAGLLLLSGCQTPKYVKLRAVPNNALMQRLGLESGHEEVAKPSERTALLLRQFDLLETWKKNRREALGFLRGVIDLEPTADKLYAYAELSYLAGRSVESTDAGLALDHYGASVNYAYMYLFDQRFAEHRNPYDPEFRGACDLYNGALEACLRIVNKNGGIQPGRVYTVNSANQSWDIEVVIRGRDWHQDEFQKFEFVSDYEVQGLTNLYQSFGLGVPLIGIRNSHEGESSAEKFYPPQLSVPVTAFLRVLSDEDVAHMNLPSGRHRCQLELHDPLLTPEIQVGARAVPVESDLSTALAYFLNDPTLDRLATFGLLRPDKSKEITGLYMLQPYTPGKIPVLMVHGLWSSPITWMEMFNDLRGTPDIREHYQFWFYLYPTGVPFWESARQLRRDLAELRKQVDPNLADQALDSMVLVGHSMGGLVSKMQVVESRDDFWKIVSDQSIDAVRADSQTRAELTGLFYFTPNNSVQRVITIGTPHRGSTFANDTTRFLAQKLIQLPQMMASRRERLFKDNPGVFKNEKLLEVNTSLDSLAPSSPILPVLLSSPLGNGVKFHNIVGVLDDPGFWGRFVKMGDGVVAFQSAHLDNADSEYIVNAEHSMVHRHPLSVLEVRRILREHLEEVSRSNPNLFPKEKLAQAQQAPAESGPRLPVNR